MKAHLRGQGYEICWPEELGGGDYFDCIALGKDLGAIELKLNNPRKTYMQAHIRKYYVDWVAVLMPSVKSLKTILNKYDRCKQIGLWHYSDKAVTVIQDAQVEPTTNHRFRKLIERFVVCRKKGISNAVAWGNSRGPSLAGILYNTKTMYGEKVRTELPLDV